MEITAREVIASILIVSFMLIIGLMLSGKISDSIIDMNEDYNKAIHIEDNELFEYGMRTSIGSSFVYGDLVAKDVVNYDDVDGDYMYLERVKERYTQHTRVVSYKCGKSTCYRTETYWTWDRVGSESRASEKVEFLGVEFNFSQFNRPSVDYIKTVQEGAMTRYKYYGTPAKVTGTIFTHLKDNNIGDNVNIYENQTIQEAYDSATFGEWKLWLFWSVWIALTCGAVYGFYYLENEWLY